MPNNNNNNKHLPATNAPSVGKHANHNTTSAAATHLSSKVPSKINFHRKTSAEIVSEAKNMLAGKCQWTKHASSDNLCFSVLY